MEGDFMKYAIVLLSFAIVFTQELEVEGDLKVTGNFDAQNNPIKNVGIPQALTDAINGNALQDALRDDGPFEYKMYITILHPDRGASDIQWIEYVEGQADAGSVFSSFFNTELFLLFNAGWKIDNVITLTPNYASGHTDYSYNRQLFIFRRPIEE